MKKCHFIFDKTQKNINLKKIFLKKYKNYPLKISQEVVTEGEQDEFINPLINSLGDTIISGVPIPIKGNIINKEHWISMFL